VNVLFGTFAKDDCFIAVHQKLRSEFGGVDDPKWKKATDQAVDRWNTLFPDHHPIPAVPFSNCLTFAYTDERMLSGGACP